jgi:hypothetical protein
VNPRHPSLGSRCQKTTQTLRKGLEVLEDSVGKLNHSHVIVGCALAEAAGIMRVPCCDS